jgi:transcriptional regulator with XRE-family HTH domain
VCTFSYFFNEQRLGYNLSIPLNIPSILENLPTPVTLGDHLRRRRLELGLHQKDVAKIIGVTTSSVWNWEHGLEPELRYQPQIITFLGANPTPCPDDLIGQLAWYKKSRGLNLIQLGKQMNRDPEQLADWFSGRCYPCRRNREAIAGYLQPLLEDS